MAHDPEGDAARYLGDDLPPQQRERFALHLLSCRDCRSEVEQGRLGRALLESGRSVAPVELRDRLRALVDAEPAVPRTPRRAGRTAAALAAVAASVVGLLAAVALAGTPEPPALREAVRDYAAGQLPGAGLPTTAAPDLSALRLRSVGAGGGDYAGLDVDGFAYRDPAGRRVVVYLSDRPFPEAPDARRIDGSDGPWLADRGELVLLCARVPHSLLVVGQDRALVRSTASALGVL